MKKFKGTKKILALLLALSLITGMMPATAFAAGTAAQADEIVDAAIIFTDLHTNKSDYKDESGEAIQNIFGTLKTTGLPFSSVTSGGDAFSVNEDSSSSNGPYNGYTDTISTAIRSALGNDNIPVNYVWSDHDRYAYNNATEMKPLDKTSHVSYGAGGDGKIGTSDDGNYYVYSLSMGDLGSYDRYKAGFSNRTANGFTATVDQAIANFQADVAKMDKTKPLLIVSHQPLFDRRDDNAFAEDWFDAINNVALGMDVAFFFGHNHKHDVVSNDPNANDYYYAKGSQMDVATQGGWNENFAVGASSNPVKLTSETKTLNFTHMCAGYMDPHSTGSYSSTTTRENTAVAVTIYKDTINFKSYGAGSYYKGNYPLDATVERAHATAEDDSENTGGTETPVIPEDAWINIPGEEKTIFKLTDTLTSGEKYVIVNKNTAGSANAVNLNNGSINSTNVTVITDTNGTYIEVPATTAQWTYNSSSKFTNVSSSSSYLRGRSSTGTLRVGDSDSSYTTWKYTTNYGLNCNKENYNLNSEFQLANRSTTKRVYIYSEDTLKTESIYVAMTGDTVFDIDLNQYTNSADVIDMVKSQISVYTAKKSDKSDAKITEDYTIVGTVDPTVAQDGHKLTVKYGDVVVETITVNVTDRQILNIEVNPTTFTVERGTNESSKIGTITVYYEGGDSKTVDLTIAMLNGTKDVNKNGTYSNLSVTYGGKTVTGLTLNVVNVSGNDYPDYPNPGSVELYKTATPLDQNTGLTRVDLSTSGLPVEKGVDVIVMLDTSSSMDRCANVLADGTTCNAYTSFYSSKSAESHKCTDSTKVARMDQLKDSLAELQNILQNAPGSDDIKIAVADFNGMYTSGATDYRCEKNGTDETTDASGLTSTGRGKVFTGTKELDETAFVSAKDLNVDAFGFTKNTDCTFSGTNYDYAFDVIYQLGYAIKEANKKANKGDRELFVLFMSDGAPNQFNYYRTQGGGSGSTVWNYWLTGTVSENGGFSKVVKCQDHTYYYDETNGNQHRMATAIKGSPNQLYDVIRKVNNDGLKDALITPAEGDKYYGKSNMYKLHGLGATMYSIAFHVSNDGPITEASAKHALSKVASSDDKYVVAEDGDSLKKAFHNIATEIAYAATNAVFTDIMGDDFKLQLGTTVKSNATDATNGKETVDTDIIVKTENVYIPSQVGTTVLGHLVTNADVGKPYGDPTELERVEFNEDGTVATSSQLEGNILKDGVICAKTFVYNTNPLEKEVELADGNKIKLGPDEFYWTIGTINQKLYTLSYMAYLTGSMEGTRESGSFKTNNLAELTYVNWLGNTVSQTVTSPVVAWGKAQVKYAFYLVNEQGQPVYANGEIAPNFEKAYKVTNPVVYNSIKLNGAEKLLSTEGSKVLPSEYTLYDEGAAYEVRPLSGDGYGEQCGWTISATPGKTLTDETSTTYVTGYNGNDYTNVMSVHEGSYAYTDTTVYFAVTWSTKALPDTVVVDYGLPVDISVLANDMFAQKTLAAVGPVVDKVNKAEYVTTLSEDFGTSKNFTYGKAEANVTKDKVRYTPTTMEMNGYDKFAYAVKSTGAGTSDQVYYYGTVTVIPATTIYYEEDFITYNDITWQQKEGGPAWEGEWAVKEVTNPEDSVWRTEGEKKANAVQGEDRPGQYSLADANHIYGYDAVNKGMSTYSLGSAKVATVTGNDGAQAQFTFWGTGFDIISMTNNTTGAILVDVEKKVDGKWTTFDNYVVDTYYGYKQVAGDADKNGTIEKGEVIWEVDPNAEDSLYQVPVIKMVNKEYGQYRVTIKATYEQFFDHVDGSSAYDFYLDAIRIYDPANDGASDGTTDTTIEDAYKADGEGWPSYIELRNKLIDTEKKFGGIWGNDDPTTGDEDERTVVEGLVFIDGDDSVGDNQITDYKNYGPNNEVYLKPGQRVAFMVNAPNNLANIHIGIKSADGIPATYTITNIAREDSADGKVKAGDYYNPKTATIDTATDMYYDMTPWMGNIVVISNTGDRYGTTGAISLTNIKSTYTSDPNGQETTGEAKAGNVEPKETSIYMTPAATTLTLRSLNTPIVPEEPETPVDPETPVVPENPVEPEEPETPPVVEEPEEPVAAPAKIISLKTDKQNYVQGDKVKVTVTTNKEATKVKVGTKVLKNFTTKNGNRTWTTTVNANKLGKLTIGAIAYNSKGTATKKVTKVVTVKKFAPRIFNVTLNKYKVKKGQKYTVTVKAGSSVKHVRVNGKKITKFTTKNGVKTFKVTFKANKVGKQKVKVIAYNKALYPSNPKVKTITVTRK